MKYIAISFLFPLFIFAQPKRGFHSYTYVFKEKKSESFNKYQGVYHGIYKDKLRHGKGKFAFENGDLYDGEWSLDDIIGKGKMIYVTGDTYIGVFKNGQKSGQGTLHYLNGDEYNGEWNNDQKNGTGEMKYSNSDEYTGRWLKDQKSGQGTLHYLNGDVYNGEWNNDQKNGTGEMKYSNSDEYSGRWLKDQKSGQGTMHYLNGDKYNGEWNNDQKNGIGEMKYSNGDTYKGSWRNGLRDGFGTLASKRQAYEGHFANDLPNGNGKITYSSNYVLIGQFENGNHLRSYETEIILDSGKLIGSLYIEKGENIFGTGFYYPNFPKVEGYKFAYHEVIVPSHQGERGFRCYEGEVNYTNLDNSWEKFFLKNDKIEGEYLYQSDSFNISCQYYGGKKSGEYVEEYLNDNGEYDYIRLTYNEGILNGPFYYFGLKGKFINNIIQKELFIENSTKYFVYLNQKPMLVEINNGSNIWNGKLVGGEIIKSLKGIKSLSLLLDNILNISKTQTGTITFGKKKKVYKNGLLVNEINPLPISNNDLNETYRCNCCNHTIYGLKNSIKNRVGSSFSEEFIRTAYYFYEKSNEAYKEIWKSKYKSFNVPSFKKDLQTKVFCSEKCHRICN